MSASNKDHKQCLVTRHTVTEARKRRVRILLAEDNAANQLAALKILEKLGYCADAVKALETLPYDLVLMDMQMPEMNGLDASLEIRNPTSTVLNHGIPIIAMTAHAMKGDREQCLVSGMNDHLPNPVNPRELSAALEHWLTELTAGIAKEAEADPVTWRADKPALFMAR
jgi:two-component system sensor histidine kinase/response regulator